MKFKYLILGALAGAGVTTAAFIPTMRSQANQPTVAQLVLSEAGDTVAGDTDSLTFTALIDDYAEAWSTEDGTLNVEAIEKLYASDPDLIFYDAILPERFVGFEDMIRSGEELFANLNRMTLTPTGDLDVRRYGDRLAWTTTVIDMEAVSAEGLITTFPMRQTAIWEQRGESWVMVHEHVSAPIGTGSGQ